MKSSLKNIIYILLIAGTVYLFYTFVSPVMSKVSEISDLKQDIEELEVQQDKIASLRTGVESNLRNISDQDRAKLDLMLPGQIDTVSLILEVEKMVVANDLVMKAINISQPDDSQVDGTGAGINTLVFDIEIEGSYDNFVGFLETIETSLRIIDLRSLSFIASQAENEEEAEENYTFTVGLQTYWSTNSL